ncbi:pyridoxal phosphate-dependent aminotransferase [Zymomonas mobilis]|uniref:histidinol-phosphate transaminase n=1 Tax=Zymomonas mobilis subsp. mobilis (strain ATCC 10988 / DSM 424 / LMG 404 / NCIMB 8938 / NRRL B-806 / ZM1) TaxID=555217 RepID=A0A0H3G0J8_ZYMMA|nr:histidinol-phosphate transaminase [Zymomonas mobilis]AEH63556.1 aminotransferase class I and II [Zymomonas mobilis subsp. mobilis ATCC 10988]TQL26710.1 histidinol-phosphate aminotransferase [Zymomonas mobilis]
MVHLNRRKILQAASIMGPTFLGNKELNAQLSCDRPIRARLNVTKNPFGPSLNARQAIAACISKAPYYIEDESELRVKIAQYEHLKVEQVGLSNGSLDTLSLLSADIGRNGTIIAPSPTYSTHLSYAQRRGITVDFIPLKNHKIDLEAIKSAITSQTALIYLCNPNNPTGTVLDISELFSFCIEISTKIPIIIDEAYYELLSNFSQKTVAPLLNKNADIIVTRTFSKVYGLAGLRIGYCLAQPQRIKQLYSLTTTSRNQAGYAAAQACFRDSNYLQGAINYLNSCRKIIYKICKNNRLPYLPSEGTFVYINTLRPAQKMKDALMSQGVDVRIFNDPNYLNWIRVGTATPQELNFFEIAISKIISNVTK